jgi:hypothetical protein
MVGRSPRCRCRQHSSSGARAARGSRASDRGPSPRLGCRSRDRGNARTSAPRALVPGLRGELRGPKRSLPRAGRTREARGVYPRNRTRLPGLPRGSSAQPRRRVLVRAAPRETRPPAYLLRPAGVHLVDPTHHDLRRPYPAKVRSAPGAPFTFVNLRPGALAHRQKCLCANDCLNKRGAAGPSPPDARASRCASHQRLPAQIRTSGRAASSPPPRGALRPALRPSCIPGARPR